MVPADTRTLLLGRNEKRAGQWTIGAGILLVASLLYFTATRTVGYTKLHPLLWWEGYAVLLTVLVAVQAYSNGGMVVSWLLTFAPVIGIVLSYRGIGLGFGFADEAPGPVELLGVATVGGVIAATIVGTLGFGIGTAVLRITE